MKHFKDNRRRLWYKVLLEDFKEFSKLFESQVKDTGRKFLIYEDYFVDLDFPFDELNCSVRYKEQVFLVRTDDDFWPVARLPWKYRHLHVEDLKALLWSARPQLICQYPSATWERRNALSEAKVTSLLENWDYYSNPENARDYGVKGNFGRIIDSP